MKTNLKYLLSIFAVATVATACSTDNGGSFANGIGDNADNAVYMGNVNASGVLSVLASDDAGASFSVTPRLARLATEPVEVTIEVDEATLADYNRKNNLSVKPIKAEDVIFTDADGNDHKGKITVTIKEGDLMAAVPSRIASLNPTTYPYGGRYAVPVRISRVSSGARLLSDPQTTIVSLNRKIKTSVLRFNTPAPNGYSMRIEPTTPYNEEQSEWTLQYIALFTEITGNNQTTASLSSSKGFYNRMSLTGGLQVKSEGRDGSDTWTNKPIKANEWLHVSYVYRKQGLQGSVSVYVNGELQKTFTTSLLTMGANMRVPGGNTDGSDKPGDGWGFGNSNVRNYYLRELRVWDRALSPAEILDKYYLPEDPASEGLAAYFPFTRESYDTTDNVYKDLTGKWKWYLTQGGTHEIVDNVVFPAKTLVIEP